MLMQANSSSEFMLYKGKNEMHYESSDDCRLLFKAEKVTVE